MRSAETKDSQWESPTFPVGQSGSYLPVTDEAESLRIARKWNQLERSADASAAPLGPDPAQEEGNISASGTDESRGGVARRVAVGDHDDPPRPPRRVRSAGFTAATHGGGGSTAAGYHGGGGWHGGWGHGGRGRMRPRRHGRGSAAGALVGASSLRLRVRLRLWPLLRIQPIYAPNGAYLGSQLVNVCY